MHVCKNERIFDLLHIKLNTYMHICVYICMHVCVCAYIQYKSTPAIYIYIHIHLQKRIGEKKFSSASQQCKKNIRECKKNIRECNMYQEKDCI